VNTYELKASQNLAAKARLYCGVGCSLKNKNYHQQKEMYLSEPYDAIILFYENWYNRRWGSLP